MLEYQSANIAKPFHVGHLRGTVIGLALDKVFRHRGYNLVTINHLGDWGTQFGFVWVGCQIWGRPAQADLEEIVNLYSRASALRKRQDKEELLPEDQGKPNANEMAREYFRKLEANDPEAVEFWQWCYEISIKYLQNICQRIGVQFDLYRGESFYRDMLPQVEATLRSANILEESRGALGVELGKPLGFARVFTEDGRSLYITRDIAAAIHRHEHFQPEKAIYVVGAPQRLHFSQLVGILDRLGHPSAKTCPELALATFLNLPPMAKKKSASFLKICLMMPTIVRLKFTAPKSVSVQKMLMKISWLSLLRLGHSSITTFAALTLKTFTLAGMTP